MYALSMFRPTTKLLSAGHYNNKGMAGGTQWHEIYYVYHYVTEIFKLNLQINY